MSAETKEIIIDIVIPVITAVLGFLGGLFSGMHIERKKTVNKANFGDGAQVEGFNQGNTVNGNVYYK